MRVISRKARITAIVLALSMLLSMAVFAGSDNFKKIREYAEFFDVAQGAWYESGIKLSYELGLFDGTGTNFDPIGKLTLAQSIKLAACLHSIYYTGKAEFVQGNPWHQVYVDYALQQKIIPTPYENYNVEATRAQFAQIFAAALPADAFPKINQIADNTIPDVVMSAEYAGAAYLLYRAGILTGSDAQGTFAPNTTISRGEAATIVTRMADVTLRKKFELEKPAVENPPIVYYKDFSMVPDFGAMYGYAVIDTQEADFTNEYTGKPYTAVRYEYEKPKKEELFDYFDTIQETNFLCTSVDTGIITSRNTVYNDIVVTTTNYAESFTVTIYKGYENVPTYEAVTYYNKGYQVPDYASVSGAKLIAQRDNEKTTQYVYDATDVKEQWIAAYLNQLFMSGYEYYDVDESNGLSIYIHHKTKQQLEIGLKDGKFYVVIVK